MPTLPLSQNFSNEKIGTCLESRPPFEILYTTKLMTGNPIQSSISIYVEPVDEEGLPRKRVDICKGVFSFPFTSEIITLCKSKLHHTIQPLSLVRIACIVNSSNSQYYVF